jgi:hypothetical protein
MQGDISQDREQLNDEIERAYINVNYAIADIKTWRVFQRGKSMMDLYETFYRNFCDLVELTGDLSQMRKKGTDVIDRASRWIDSAKKPGMQDKEILVICENGITVFISYKKLLIDENVISLPKR